MNNYTKIVIYNLIYIYLRKDLVKMNSLQHKQPTLILLIVVFFWFAQYVYVPYQTTHLLLSHISSNIVGTIIGAYGISQLALRLPVGVLADLSSNHKLFIVLGTFLAGIASLFRIILPEEIGFLLGNILSGAASATWISFMILFMSYYSQEEQVTATSKIVLANNLGMLVGFVVSTLLYDQVGMTMICLFSLISGATGCLLSFFIKTTKPTQLPKLTILELLGVIKNKDLLLFSCLALVQQGVQMSTTMSFTNQLIKDLGASNIIVGSSSIIYMLSAVLFAKLASTNLLNLLPKQVWIYSSFSLLGIYCIFVSNTNSIAIICFLQIIPGMGTGILFSLLTSQALKTIDLHKRSTAMGFFQAVYALGMTLFPMISGFVNETISMRAAFLFLAGTCFFAIPISIAGFRFRLKEKNSY